MLVSREIKNLISQSRTEAEVAHQHNTVAGTVITFPRNPPSKRLTAFLSQSSQICDLVSDFLLLLSTERKRLL